MRYEDYLAALFKAGHGDLRLMALAHIAGFADRVPGWLASAKQGFSESSSAPALRRVFDALLTGDVATIEAALLSRDVLGIGVTLDIVLAGADPSDPRWLDEVLTLVVEPLILLGRVDLLPTLHANSLQRLGPKAKSSLTADAARDLATADEWGHALEILQRARRHSGDIRIETVYEAVLWKYAYVHRRVDTAMPVLAEIPFSADFPHLVEYRAWKLKAYQIRAGMPGIVVPVIEGDQPHGYSLAVAMQIAALADDPSAAELVRNLRRVLRPRTIEFILADRGVAGSITDFPKEFSTEEAQIAARRREYAKLAALARMPVGNILIAPSSIVIDALLDEGDWRAAADIAKEHDPRKARPIPGFDDDRVSQYVSLYQHLALAAAGDGEHAAAAAFLAKAKNVDRTEIRDGDGEATDGVFHFPETLLAGLAEGLLPRKYLHLLTWPFRPPR
jgi:hypothetical protein